MNIEKRKVVDIFSIIAIGITIIGFFIITKEKNTANYIALAFLIFSELLFPYCFKSLLSIYEKINKTFLTFSSISIISVYFIITLALSLISSSFNENEGGLLLIELIITFILIATIAIFYKIALKEVLPESIEQADMWANEIFEIKQNNKASDLKDDLEKVYEALKYLDNVGTTQLDSEVTSLINELKVLTNEKILNKKAVAQKIFDLENTLENRKNILLTSKRGGF